MEKPIKLWNGLYYPQDVLNHACPRLSTYAQLHACLEETIAYSVQAMFRARMLPIVIAGVLVYCFMVSIHAAQNWRAMPAVGFLANAVGLAAFVGVLWMVAVTFQVVGMFIDSSKRYPFTVRVENGVLTVTSPGVRHQTPLCDCQWRIVPAWRVKGVSKYHPQRHRDVVLITYQVVDDCEQLNTKSVMCGATNQMRELWVGFLTIAGIQRNDGHQC
jgi:hypothetical protein